jgi:hypothetical protein
MSRFHLMEDGKMTPIDRVATEDIGANSVSRIRRFLSLANAVVLRSEARESMQLMSRCMCPQDVCFIHIVSICFGTSRVVGRESEAVKVIRSSDNGVASDVILIRRR